MLRNMGNHQHNREVLRTGKGTLALGSRSKEAGNPEEFSPCPKCFVYLHTKILWRHRCPMAKSEDPLKRSASVRLLLPPPLGISAKMQGLLSAMRLDEISRVARSDRLIMALAK